MQNSSREIFKSLQDSELLKLTFLAAKKEKAATLALLDYLLEVDARKLYATVNACASLFEYLVNELGFSEPAAADRVNTVRLMRAVPEVKKHLEAGALTLTSAAQIQRFVNAEQRVHPKGKAVSAADKEKVVNECLGKSKREVEKTLFEQQSEPARILTQEKVKFVTSTRAELKFSADKNLLLKLSQVKTMLGEQSLEKIFDQALDALLLSEKKKRGFTALKRVIAVPATIKNRDENEGIHHSTHLQNYEAKENDASFNRPAESVGDSVRCPSLKDSERSPVRETSLRTGKRPNSRFIPIKLKQFVYARSLGRCEFMSSNLKLRCKSTDPLQIDHILPISLGGKTEAVNLRHLCATHNQRSAIEMGLKKPTQFDTNV